MMKDFSAESVSALAVKFFKIISTFTIAFFTLPFFLHVLNVLLNLIDDSLARIYLVSTSILAYTLILSYIICILFKVKVPNKIRNFLQRTIKYVLPYAFTYIILYILLHDRMSAIIIHVTLISLPTIFSKITQSYNQFPFSKNSFCDGFIVKGFIVKRIILLLQVYPSTSLEDTVNELTKYGEIFLVKNPFGYIILFKRTTSCIFYKLWKRFFLKRFLSFSQELVPAFCHLKALSYKEVDEIVNRLYIRAEPMLSKNMFLFDLIYFPKNGGIQSCNFFKCDSKGLNVLSIKKNFPSKCIKFDEQANFRTLYDSSYLLLKSLYILKSPVEDYGEDCPVKAYLFEDGCGYMVKILSSPKIFFERDQLNLQLTLYSINFKFLQKG
ncbi:MAG: hypothetical protein H5T50_00155 [Nitrososphaeria archaeon]|nr:hypothetical protein [Nitrososphaeria archaeon]